jgi:hypothetical protein
VLLTRGLIEINCASFVNRLPAPQRPAPSESGVDLAVELRAARIPLIGAFAWHHWFVVERLGGKDRWEVWQRTAAGGESWGYLHRNLLPPERGVGNGPSWTVRRWTGPSAAALAERIEDSPASYPFPRRYWFWPGPNSNTYVQWILRSEHRLTWQAWGRRYAEP